MTESSSGRNPSRRRFLATAAAAVAAPPALTRHLAGLAPPELSLMPLLARPTGSSILINARTGADDVTATVEVWASYTGERVWQRTVRAAPNDFVEWSADGLKPGT